MQCKNPHWMVWYNDSGIRYYAKETDFLTTEQLQSRLTCIRSKIEIPCRMCMACRINYTTEWKNRLIAEATDNENNYFLTLTYTDKDLPKRYIVNEDGTLKTDINGKEVVAHPLCKKDLQDFNKRLRRYWEYNYHHVGIRHYGVGEYGDEKGRPHYHEILYNCPIKDLQEIGSERRVMFGHKVEYKKYYSKTIQKLWPKGMILIGEFNDSTAGYVAGYAMKKQRGKSAKDWYHERGLEPEFAISSRKPGIGFNFFDQHRAEILEKDRLLMVNAWGGTRVPIPQGFAQAAIRETQHKYDSKGNYLGVGVKARYDDEEVERNRSIRKSHQPRKEAAAEAYLNQIMHNSTISLTDQIKRNAEITENKMRTKKGKL